MRIIDWSSDVCSSDLISNRPPPQALKLDELRDPAGSVAGGGKPADARQPRSRSPVDGAATVRRHRPPAVRAPHRSSARPADRRGCARAAGGAWPYRWGSDAAQGHARRYAGAERANRRTGQRPRNHLKLAGAGETTLNPPAPTCCTSTPREERKGVG